MMDDISPTFEELVKEWLATQTLEEILAANDLDAEALLHILLQEGHIVPPPYLDHLIDYGDRDDRDDD